MSIKFLETIVTPPKDPKEVPDSNLWQAVETNFTRLPADYQEFVSRYGTGSIDSFIWIFNPASRNLHLNLQRQVEKQLQALKEINLGKMEPVIPLFPALNGVLPFGITDNGDVLLWETKGDPENWNVGVLGARSSPIVKYEMNMTSFLAGICGGTIVCDIFPDGFPNPKPAFSLGF